MFHNYFFIRRLADALNEKLVGYELIECFSQNKDELILIFVREKKSFVIRANLDANISLIAFPEQFARAGKNSVDLFQNLIGQFVNEVGAFRFERSFYINLGRFLLIFKLHGRRSNVLLAQDNKMVAIFRKSLQNDLELIPGELGKKITISQESFQKHNEDPLELIPALGKEIRNHLDQIEFYSLDSQTKWETFEEILRQLDQNPIYLHSKPEISLLAPSDEETGDPIAASNWLYEKTVRSYYYDREKQEAINKLKQRIKKSESYIHKTSEKLRTVEKSRNPEEVANILMANLHQLQQGMTEAVLHDLYTNETIRIKLSETLSPQKNAEKLYRKAKNRHQEINNLKENIRAKEDLIDKLSRQILHLDEIEDIKELRGYIEKLGLKEKKKSRNDEPLPYHRFEVEGWEILLGKHAKANDELTLKVANKNDLWLHAKDVAGSHVIVRQRPGQNYPKHIIERAGALAAANSKRKTDTLCPVIYTLKKFVRKAKGAPPGQVIVEKEDILMIEPMNIS